MRARGLIFLVIALALLGTSRAADDPLDAVGEALSFADGTGDLRGRVSGTFDLELYELAQPNPGLFYTESPTFLNPRLALFFDGRWGSRLYGFAQVRADRGFDPNADTSRLRADEYALRLALTEDRTLVLEAGKFAMVLGNWVARHGSWENPLISAPLPYENVTAISGAEAPAGPANFVPPEPDEKYEYCPVLWGPSYATGAALRGTAGRLDYAVEVKNAGPSSAPASWSLAQRGFDNPSFTGRVAFRPDLRWCVGFSASDSGYFESAAAASLPAGHGLREYRQRLFAQDLSFAWHRLQLWAEFFENTFDVPRLGRARTWAGYVEAKYKLTAQLYGAFRVNRQEFSPMSAGAAAWRWGADAWRTELATGWRLTPHVQVKVELGWDRRDTRRDQVNLATQFTVRF